VLLSRSNFSQHLPWILACLIATALAALWYFSASAARGEWLGGTSGPGFALGVAGGGICLFEFLIWPRKAYFRTWRIGKMTIWMRAHIWLGLLAVPLLLMHSGFALKSVWGTAAMVLFLIVIVSGVWGLIMQQYLPSKMLQEIPAETIHSQVAYVSRALADEGRRLVAATCGPLESEKVDPAEAEAEAAAGVEHFVVGAVRAAERVHGKVLKTLPAPAAPVPESESLRVFFRETVRPYLLGQAARSPLATAEGASEAFTRARAALPEGAHSALAVLEDSCYQRRQFEQQLRLHAWLHGWLLIHLPLSVALMLIMVVHAFLAMKNW
jgi:hypothetical protein